jgi:hypothetical protein
MYLFSTMNDPFELPVIFNGKEMMFQSQLQQYGYVHKLKINVNGNEVMFEPDEERQYRAIVSPEAGEKIKQTDIELLKLIAEALGAL